MSVIAETNASTSSGGTEIPAPLADSMRVTSVPESMAATTGRAAAQMLYVFDGTLTAPSPARSGTT